MAKKSCEQFEIRDGKTVKTFSYVAVMCEINGSEVKAIRIDGYERKMDVSSYLFNNMDGWRIKGIYKLYDEDFEPYERMRGNKNGEN